MIADVPDTVADLIADAWMFLSPLVEQRWQRPPFSSRHPDKCIAMRLAILGDGFNFYPDIYEGHQVHHVNVCHIHVHHICVHHVYVT